MKDDETDREDYEWEVQMEMQERMLEENEPVREFSEEEMENALVEVAQGGKVVSLANAKRGGRKKKQDEDPLQVAFAMLRDSSLSEADAKAWLTVFSKHHGVSLTAEQIRVEVNGAYQARLLKFGQGALRNGIWLRFPLSEAHLKTGAKELLLKPMFDRLGLSFRHNSRSGRPQLHSPNSGWQNVSNPHIAWLLHQVVTRLFTGDTCIFNPIWHPKQIEAHVEVLARNNEIDPFKDEYLDTLEWDGTKRIERLFWEFFEVEDGGDKGRIAEIAGVQLLLGAVARTYDPGCKHDNIPILIGDEGCWKSSFCFNLVPHKEFYSDNFDFTWAYERMIERTQGKVIIEAQEMPGLENKSAAQVKRILSQYNENSRPLYMRYSEDCPRRYALIGTTNEPKVLPPDTTGNRRIFPVFVARKAGMTATALEAKMRELRDQLWAEAVAWYKEGRDYTFDEAMTAVRRLSQNIQRNPGLKQDIEQFIATWPEDRIALGDIRQQFNLTAPEMTDKALRRLIQDHKRFNPALGNRPRTKVLKREKGNEVWRDKNGVEFHRQDTLDANGKLKKRDSRCEGGEPVVLKHNATAFGLLPIEGSN